MRRYEGRVIAIQHNAAGERAAWIRAPRGAYPAPGQYILAQAAAQAVAQGTGGDASPLPAALYLAQEEAHQFLAAAPVPLGWTPGTSLLLGRPLGRGFAPPEGAMRLALVALDRSPDRLLALMRAALRHERAMTLVAGNPLPGLPAAVEVQPLADLPEVLRWADYLALDVPWPALASLRTLLGLRQGESPPCPAQILVHLPMPCAAVAECGVCAVPARRGWKLACKDGPVFDLAELEV